MLSGFILVTNATGDYVNVFPLCFSLYYVIFKLILPCTLEYIWRFFQIVKNNCLSHNEAYFLFDKEIFVLNLFFELYWSLSLKITLLVYSELVCILFRYCLCLQRVFIFTQTFWLFYLQLNISWFLYVLIIMLVFSDCKLKNTECPTFCQIILEYNIISLLFIFWIYLNNLFQNSFQAFKNGNIQILLFKETIELKQTKLEN